MERNLFAEKAHSNAVNHGFWKIIVSNEHYLALICTEIAEAIEADRQNKIADVDRFKKSLVTSPFAKLMSKDKESAAFAQYIKHTIQDEFADIYIRLGDLAGKLGVDFTKMNPCKYYRAFDKFTFTENAFALIKGLCKDKIAIEKRIQFAMDFVENWAKYEGIELEYFIGLKMNYNESREMLHGKKY